MKDNWQKKPLGELVSTQKGKISEQSTFPLEGFAPIINMDVLRGDIKVWGKVLGSVNCIKNDVLILWDGERSGLCATGYEGVVGSTFAKMSVSNELDSNFLYRFVDFNFDWIQGQRTGTGVPHVPKNLNTILTVNYPPLPQQKKIAKILSTCDAVIEKTEAAIAKYQDIKQGMMHDLFTSGIDLATGKLRPTPEQAPDLYKDSELGEIPKDWEVGLIADVVEDNSPITYGIVQPGDFSKDGVLLIRGKDYISGWVHESEFFKVKKDLHLQFKRSTTVSGDILICIVGATYGAIGVVPNWVKEANITQTTARIRCNQKKFIPTYVEYYLKSSFGRMMIEKYVKGSAQPGLNLSDIEKFIICHPLDIEEQVEIGKRIQSLDKKIISEKDSLNKQKDIKSGLMQDLLTGKVEVKEEQEETA